MCIRDSFGGTPSYVFRRVTLPMISRGIFAGWLMIFIIAFRELVTASLIAPPNTLVVSTYINREFEQESVSSGCATVSYTHLDVYKRQVFGRSVYAVGSNAETAKMSGINVQKVKLLAQSITGLMAGMAGIVMLCRMVSIQANTGEGYEFEGIFASVVGGVSMAGGEGTIFGAVIGALVVAVLRNGLNLNGINSLSLIHICKSWNAGWVVCFARVLWSKHTAGWTSCSGNSCDLYPLYHIGVDSTREIFRIFEFFAIDFIKRFQTFLKSWRKFARRIGKTA